MTKQKKKYNKVLNKNTVDGLDALLAAHSRMAIENSKKARHLMERERWEGYIDAITTLQKICIAMNSVRNGCKNQIHMPDGSFTCSYNKTLTCSFTTKGAKICSHYALRKE